MNSDDKISRAKSTEFLPYERAQKNKVLEQNKYFASIPLLDQLLGMIPNIILILNKERQVVYANKPLFKFLGLEDGSNVMSLRPGEIFKCKNAVNGACGTTEFCRYCGSANAIFKAQKNVVPTVEESRIIREDGEVLDLRIWAVPFVHNNEQFTVFTVSDIKDEKRRRVLERIFFHDILNIAGVIKSSAQLLVFSGDGDSKELERIIVDSSTRLINEIEEQRDLLTIEGHEFVPKLASIDSLKFLQSLVQAYLKHETSKERYIDISPQAMSVIFISDETMLERVIGNMIKNALEASEPGQKVTVNCSQASDNIQFEVHNQKFMPKKIQLQLFQRSFSTKGPGRGIGTYSMKLITEKYLKGKISFLSSEEKGTTFKVEYPIMPSQPG